MTEPFRVISLGWGVQSFAMAAMVALGELPPVDAAVHADTTHERRETYEFAARWTPWLEAHGVRVVTVGDPNQAAKVTTEKSDIPAFTVTRVEIAAYSTYPDGTDSGMLRRQCTGRWKLQPIRRWVQANRAGRPVQQWIGITLDEVERMRVSDVRYIENVYPLVQMVQPRMTRTAVMQWLQAHDLEIPVKSSCVFCPFHDRATWREIQRQPDNWRRAMDVDQAIRHKRPGYVCYLTAARKPLEECDFSNQQDHGQLELWQECTGMCFL